MSNVAQLRLDGRSGKWLAQYKGLILASSPNKDYVVNNIREGRCTKAKAHNVTDVFEIGVVETDSLSGKVQPVSKFTITERFDFMEYFAMKVADRTFASMVVTGDGGLGKTHTIMEALRKAGLRDISDLNEMTINTTIDDRKFFTVIKGFSTAKGLYRSLWENRNRTVVFDDCDSILKDANALNILKGGLDSYDKRIISWNAESFGDDDLPRSFEFKGGVIFISNMSLYKLDKALRTRANCVDVTMTPQEKIERMEWIIKRDTFMPDHSEKHKRMALDFIEQMKNEVSDLSFRTLIQVIKIAASGGEWKRRAEYVMTNG